MAEKTYGLMKVTEREYQMARKVSKSENADLAECAFQTVRYCEGQIFIRDDVETFVRAVREAEPRTAAGSID